MGISCCFIILVVLACVYICEGRIYEKRLCGDPTCSDPVSIAKTLIPYTSNDARVLSFAKNVDCVIYSKSAGSKQDLWGAEIKGIRGYVPSQFVREYKILKSSLKFVVNAEEAESIRNISVKNVTDKSLNNVSIVEVNNDETSNLEATLNDVEQSGLEPEHGSGLLTETPSLDDSSTINLPFADMGLLSFSGSGVSAEPIEGETPPSHEGITQPFQVVYGTTVYYDTDGEQTESKLPLQQVQPTFTSLSSLPSVVPEQKSKLSNQPPSVPSIQVGEPSMSVEFVSVDNVEKVMLETQHVEVTEAETVEEKENESEERTELESELFADKKEADSVTDADVESVVEHKQEAENIEKKYVESIDETKREAEAEGKKEEITKEPVKELVVETEGSEEYDEEDLEDEDEDDEDEEVEEEVSKEVTESPSTDTKEQEPLEQVKAINVGDALAQPADADTSKLEDQGVVHLTPETDTNINDASVNNTEADGLNLQADDLKDVSEKLTDLSETSKEVAIDESSTLEYKAPLPVSESQDVYAYADQTERSADELEHTKIREAHAVLTEVEGSGVKEQESMQQVSAETENPLHSIAGDKSVERKDVIDDSGEEIKSVHGSDYLEDTSADVKTQYVNVHPELMSDKITDNNSEISSEMMGEIKSNLSEEPHIDSIQEQTEITTASSEEEEEYDEVPPSAEEVSTATTTYPSEELLVPVEGSESVSEQEGIVENSGGLFSGMTDTLSAGIGVLTSMFGDSSSDLNVLEVPEEVNESKLEVTTEEIPHTGEAEEMNRKREGRDAVWSSLWGVSTTEHTTVASRNHHLNEEREGKSSVCRVNYDPSAGIDSDCSDVAGDLPGIHQQPEGVPIVSKGAVTAEAPEDDNFTMDLQRSSYATFIYLIITAATVLLFSLGHYYIEKKRRDGSLVAKINSLEKELLASSQECLILKDDLQTTKEKLYSIESSSTDNSEVVAALNAELEESKVAKAELEEQVASLEKELEAATEAGLELNRMLSEFLSAQHGSDTVMKSVEQLQKQLDSQQSTISTMTASLNAKSTENETLQADLTAAKDKISSLEEDMQKVTENLNDVLSAKLLMEEELLEKNKSLQTQLREVEDRISRVTDQFQNEKRTLQETVNELKDNLVTKESEIVVLQDFLKQLKNASDEEDDDDKLQALFDVGHTKAELKRMTIERDTLAEKLQGEEDARKLLEDHMKVISEEVTRLTGNYEEAEREKVEAQTRLEVLSNYFKEKETQLQKELGLQEAMCLQKQGDETSTYERIKSLEEEIENYKSQNETLKKEILDQERGLKFQIATMEKKAHENWVAARQAERKLEESKQEASQLRNRLTVVEKNVTNASKTGETPKMNDRIPGDSNSELPTSPVDMGISAFQDSPSSPLHYQHHDGLPASPPLPVLIPGQPLPPSPFMGMPPLGMLIPPPLPGAPFMAPPPPLYPGDRRPPPLGRMSSPPPPPHRYSPPPPDPRGSFSPYDHSPPPSPPLGRPYRSPPPHGDDSPDGFRQHRSPPPPDFNPYFSLMSRPPPHREDSHGNPCSGFRPMPPPTHRDSPREPKGSALSSGHSSESLEKSSRHSGRV